MDVEESEHHFFENVAFPIDCHVSYTCTVLRNPIENLHRIFPLIFHITQLTFIIVRKQYCSMSNFRKLFFMTLTVSKNRFFLIEKPFFRL